MRKQNTGLQALFLAVGSYLWRNRYELREKLDQSEPARRLGMDRLLRLLRTARGVDRESEKDRPIEAEFRKIS